METNFQQFVCINGALCSAWGRGHRRHHLLSPLAWPWRLGGTSSLAESHSSFGRGVVMSARPEGAVRTCPVLSHKMGCGHSRCQDAPL